MDKDMPEIISMRQDKVSGAEGDLCTGDMAGMRMRGNWRNW